MGQQTMTSMMTLVDEAAYSLVTDFGFESGHAREFAERLVTSMSKHLGGTEVYVPALASAKRRDAIKSEFTGRNTRELAKQYDVTVRTVRRLVKEKKKSG